MPDTPYRRQRLPETLATVNDLQKQDAEDRFVNFTLPSGVFVFGQKVSIAYARGDKWGNTETSFIGRVEGETADRRIDFAVVRDVAIASKDATSATLKLTLFPDISAEELLKNKPTYVALKKRYTRTITLRLALRSPSGGDLALTGEEQHSTFDSTPAKRRVIALFKDLPPGQSFELQDGAFHHPWWWAVQSVANDPAYPHRIVTKK